MDITEWADYVYEILNKSRESAQPTGSSIEPKAIVSFSIEIVEEMVAKYPDDRRTRKAS